MVNRFYIASISINVVCRMDISISAKKALAELEQHQRFWGNLAKMECKEVIQ